MHDIRRIMAVASDIKHSREVVRYGVSLAKKYDAELVVLHEGSPLRGGGSNAGEGADPARGTDQRDPERG